MSCSIVQDTVPSKKGLHLHFRNTSQAVFCRPARFMMPVWTSFQISEYGMHGINTG